MNSKYQISSQYFRKSLVVETQNSFVKSLVKKVTRVRFLFCAIKTDIPITTVKPSLRQPIQVMFFLESFNRVLSYLANYFMEYINVNPVPHNFEL